MGQLVPRQLFGELADGVGRERHQAAAGDRAWVVADVSWRDPLAGGAEQVVLRLQILEIEDKCEDGIVSDGAGNRRALGRDRRAPLTAESGPDTEGRQPLQGVAPRESRKIVACHGGSSIVLGMRVSCAISSGANVDIICRVAIVTSPPFPVLPRPT